MEPEGKASSRGRETALSLVLSGLFGGGFLLFLILVSGGFFVSVLLAVVAMAAVGLFHYFLWGQALTHETVGECDKEAIREHLQGDSDHPDGTDRQRIRRL